MFRVMTLIDTHYILERFEMKASGSDNEKEGEIQNNNWQVEGK